MLTRNTQCELKCSGHWRLNKGSHQYLIIDYTKDFSEELNLKLSLRILVYSSEL